MTRDPYAEAVVEELDWLREAVVELKFDAIFPTDGVEILDPYEAVLDLIAERIAWHSEPRR